MEDHPEVDDRDIDAAATELLDRLDDLYDQQVGALSRVLESLESHLPAIRPSSFGEVCAETLEKLLSVDHTRLDLNRQALIATDDLRASCVSVCDGRHSPGLRSLELEGLVILPRGRQWRARTFVANSCVLVLSILFLLSALFVGGPFQPFAVGTAVVACLVVLSSGLRSALDTKPRIAVISEELVVFPNTLFGNGYRFVPRSCQVKRTRLAFGLTQLSFERGHKKPPAKLWVSQADTPSGVDELCGELRRLGAEVQG